jgi:hypothetical protein
MRLRGHDTRVELFLHMSADNLEEVLSHAAHEVKIVGVAQMPELEGVHRRFTITDGTLNVAITDDRRVDTKLLVYRLKLVPTGAGGSPAKDEKTALAARPQDDQLRDLQAQPVEDRHSSPLRALRAAS